MEQVYENFKNVRDCLYVDLDSESSDKMLYKCSDTISKKLNKALEKKEVVEGFSLNECCPDGTTNINNQCVKVCKNCKYNDCEKGSGNIGVYYKEKFGNKAKIHQEMDTEMFNYIVNEIN